MILALLLAGVVFSQEYDNSTDLVTTDWVNCNATDPSPISLVDLNGNPNYRSLSEDNGDEVAILELEYDEVEMIGRLDSELRAYVLQTDNGAPLGKLTRVKGTERESYSAYQVRFRTPAEHEIEHDGSLDLEVQIFHQKDGDDSLATLSILYQANDDEPSYFLDEAKKANDNTRSIDLRDALLGWEKVREFFEYEGTDTAISSCDVPVTWWVYNRVLPMEKDQLTYFINQLEPLSLDQENNARPIASTNDRAVTEYYSAFEESAFSITLATVSLLLAIIA
jgi:hypothetical protein